VVITFPLPISLRDGSGNHPQKTNTFSLVNRVWISLWINVNNRCGFPHVIVSVQIRKHNTAGIPLKWRRIDVSGQPYYTGIIKEGQVDYGL
jgi:hypothetical protein